jgi:hypothetical protein
LRNIITLQNKGFFTAGGLYRVALEQLSNLKLRFDMGQLWTSAAF